MDKGLSTISVITLLILVFVLSYFYENLMYVFLIAVTFFMVLEYMVRAFFEWKYTQYPKQAILTLSEIFLILIAIMIVIQFKLLGSD
jgi:predicted PurR-regulated permease PerM